MTIATHYLQHLPPELMSISDSTWEQVNNSTSGTTVYSGQWNGLPCFLKITPQQHPHSVAEEFERLCWLRNYAPIPDVLAFASNDEYAYLITESIAGVPIMASHLPMPQRLRQYGQIMRDFHDMPLHAFEMMSVMTPEMQITRAYQALEAGMVQPHNFEAPFTGRDPEALFEQLLQLWPRSANPAVIHGAPFSENMLVQADDGRPMGFIDVGQVAVADRYTDLAIIRDEIVATYGEEAWNIFLQGYGLREIVPRKLRFFCLLHQFTQQLTAFAM